MGWLYLGGRTIQEVGGEMKMGLSIYGVAVMDGSLYSRLYGISAYAHPVTMPSDHAYCPHALMTHTSQSYF